MKAIQQASGVDFNAEGLVYEFAKQRLWLPARLMGGALRSQTKVAEAAYISGLIAALPSLIDVTMTVQGTTEVRQGFANVVGERLLGVGACNRGNEQNRFAYFVHESGSGLGDRFARLWRQLQREVAKEGQSVPTDGALSATVEAAGYVDGNEVKKMQRELTQQRDQAAFERLDAQIQARPQNDPIRMQWLSMNRYSSQFVSSLPLGQHTIMSNAYLLHPPTLVCCIRTRCSCTRILAPGARRKRLAGSSRRRFSRSRLQGTSCSCSQNSRSLNPPVPGRKRRLPAPSSHMTPRSMWRTPSTTLAVR